MVRCHRDFINCSKYVIWNISVTRFGKTQLLNAIINANFNHSTCHIQVIVFTYSYSNYYLSGCTFQWPGFINTASANMGAGGSNRYPVSRKTPRRIPKSSYISSVLTSQFYMARKSHVEKQTWPSLVILSLSLLLVVK